jgi:hypothetical protein
MFVIEMFRVGVIWLFGGGECRFHKSTLYKALLQNLRVTD